jgi:hypothetical protein
MILGFMILPVWTPGQNCKMYIPIYIWKEFQSTTVGTL